MWIAVVSTTAAIAMFTWTKWEVERRLKELPDADREAWMAGDYKEYKEKQLSFLARNKQSPVQPVRRRTVTFVSDNSVVDAEHSASNIDASEKASSAQPKIDVVALVNQFVE